MNKLKLSVVLIFAMFASFAYAQNLQVSGIVTDQAGEALIGVSVHVEGTTNAVYTDADGAYSLLNVPSNGVLVYSSFGMQEIKQNVNGRAVINITMLEDTKLLDEIVVIGYGQQKKVNLTGAVSTVDPEEIQDRATTNIMSSLQGLVPGVTIINRPGSSPEINIRGRGNLGTSSPLYVVDGIIVSSTFFSSLDPTTIENMSFLKDAASSSIYGSRAAYGVVLITTKKGKEGSMQISYNGSVTAQMINYAPEYANSWEYAELYNETAYNSDPNGGKYQMYTADEIELFRNGSQPDLYPNSQWVDLAYDDVAFDTQHSINFSGGSEKIRFFSNLGYLHDTGNLPGPKNQRYNMSINVIGDMKEWLTFRGGIKYIQGRYDRDHGVASLQSMLNAPSTMVAVHSNGEWGTVVGGKEGSNTILGFNPIRPTSYNNWAHNINHDALYEAAIDIKPFKGLVITAQGSFKNYDYKNKSYSSTKPELVSFLTGEVMSGSGNDKNKMTMSWGGDTKQIYNLTANYNVDIKDHTFSALLGTSYESSFAEYLGATRGDFPADTFTDMSAGATSGTDYTNSPSMYEWKMMSYFGRLNYDYKDKYLVEVNARIDGSSRFHPDNRYGFFPSGSVAWRISQEDFMESTRNWLSELKLRASYGTLGNINNVGNYDYFANYGKVGNYPMGGTPSMGLGETKPANTTLGWETLTMFNVGLDFTLLDGKLYGTLEYYKKNTNDILLSYPVAPEVGVSSNPSQNIAQVSNNGIETSLMWRDQIGDFRYSIGGNVAYNQNEILDLATANDIITATTHNVMLTILREGAAIGSYYGLASDGLYTQEEIDAGEYYTYGGLVPNAGDTKFLPNGDREYGEAITAADRVIIGSNVPNLTYGINLSAGYKGFEFTAFGQGVNGTSVAFEVYQMHPFFHGFDNVRTFHMGRWTEENPNPNAVYPRVYSNSDPHTAYNRTFNSMHVFDADYFRIKTLNLSYTFETKTANKFGLQGLKMYLNGENLITIRADKKMGDFDPESPNGVISTLGYKSVTFGINMTF